MTGMCRREISWYTHIDGYVCVKMTPISPDLSILWPISPDILTRSWLTLNFQTEEMNTSFSIHWSKKLVETFFYLFPAKQFLRNRQKKGILGWTFISWWTLINFQQNFQGRRLLHTGRLLIWTDFPGWRFIPTWSSIRQWRVRLNLELFNFDK